MEGRKASERDKKQGKGKEDGSAASEPDLTNNDSTMEGQKRKAEECCTPDFIEDQSTIERRDDNLSKAGAAEELPDVSDMLLFTLDSPGGACAVSLSLMCLGLLSVHISIPKQIVVVDSTLVDNDAVKT